MSKPFIRCLGAAALLLAGNQAEAQSDMFDQIESFRWYGFFSPSVVNYDDGRQTYSFLADSSAAPGRIGFWFDVPSNRGQLKFNFETSLGLRLSSSVTQFSTPDIIDINSATLRKLELIYNTENLGTFSFGQGSMGSDGTAESDLSGTTLAGYVGISDTVGGFFFRNTAGSLTSIDISSAFPTFDGGRAPRIRWDSPDLNLSVLGTLNIAASAGFEVSSERFIINDTVLDTGVFYRNKIGDTDIKGSAGFSLANVNGDLKPQSAGSISFLHNPSSANFTFAAGSRSSGGEYAYTKIGWTANWFQWGETAIAFDYYQGKGTVVTDSKADSYGIGLVQKIDRSDLQIFIGLRRYTYSQPGPVQFQSSNSIVVGTRWDFRNTGLGFNLLDWRDRE